MNSLGKTDEHTGLAPSLSVIMPAYNCSAYISEALNSILSQGYPNLEIIVVDDGSRDGTAEIAEGYGAPVRVIRQKNGGPAAARNRAAKEATGDFLSFLDGDDLWLPGKLNAQMKHLLAHPEVGIIYGGFLRWVANKNGSYPVGTEIPGIKTTEGLDENLSGWIYHQLLRDNYIHIITSIVSRKLFETIGGFDEALRIGEDYDFWLRATRLVQAHKLARDVALYRVNPASTTHIARPINVEHVVLTRTIKKFGLASPDGAKICEAHLEQRLFKLAFDHGYVNFWHGSPVAALDSFSEAIKFKKNRLKSLVYLAMSYVLCKWVFVTKSVRGSR